MTSASGHDSVTFTLDTRAAFLQHLVENPNNRRVSPSAKEDLIEWLTNPHKRPSSQEDFSRRNYVRKTFAWDEESRSLLAVAKKDEGKVRTVITTDMIVDVVEMVHKVSGDSGHGGWDATWKNVSSSYYGILRSDVIFLLKQCQVCTQNPSKRPKGTAATMLHFQPTSHEYGDNQNTDDNLNTGDNMNTGGNLNTGDNMNTGGNLNTGDMQHRNSTLNVPECSGNSARTY